MRLRLIALAVLVALGAQPIAYAVDNARQYTVKPGDTLGAISARIGVPQQQLIDLNSLPDANLIRDGQILTLPGDAPAAQPGSSVPPSAPQQGTAPPTDAREYVVRPGDNISAIAASFGVPLNSLVEANQLAQPDRLATGQRLMLPASSASGAPNAAASNTAIANGGAIGALLNEMAVKYKLDPVLVKALSWYLSSWRADAASAGGAVGPMQITASTQDWVGRTLLKRAVDRTIPRDNAEIGVAYLAYLVNRFGDERQGVAAYLQGPSGLATSGVSPSTARALEAIYASRGRFSGQPDGATTSLAAITQPAPAGRNLAADIGAVAKTVAPNARFGVAARNLGTGERIDVRSGEVYPSASVNKLPIMIELLRQIGAGKLKRTPAVTADLEQMIVVSDNAAANRLLDAVGEDNVNREMAALGFSNTLMHNHFSGTPDEPGFNQSTPADMAGLLTLLANDALIGPAAGREMRDLLSRTRDASKMVRGLPAGARVYHKSGWYPTVANDAAVVSTARGSYVLAVFSRDLPDDETGNRLIAEISRLVYQAWGG
jgi:beta-lactamase class A/LysM repeat protein